ncbi:50S ribosomal protein L21 [soil metagenome]
MFAIIQEGGGQRMVEKGETILVDLISNGTATAGSKHTFGLVLLLSGDGASAGKVGMPMVSGASVIAEIIEPVVKGEKIFIHKFRRRKGFKKKTGHRQAYTKVKILEIHG